MALLFKSETDRADLWRSAFAKADPKLDFRQWPDVGDPGDIDFALVWHPIKGDLKRYPNLKAIFSLGAGIEHIFSDPELPKHIPVVRMVDHGLTKGMTEYVLFHVLRFHRRVPEIEAQHRAGVWKNIDCPAAWERRVGVMGLGVLGGDAALESDAVGLGPRVAVLMLDEIKPLLLLERGLEVARAADQAGLALLADAAAKYRLYKNELMAVDEALDLVLCRLRSEHFGCGKVHVLEQRRPIKHTGDVHGRAP
jgi:hypothetical protein